MAFQQCSRRAQAHGKVPTEEKWDSIRPMFEQLYINEQRKLTQVVSELRCKHDFRATIPMYKRRIREWGLGKNLKQNEVEHILGISAQRRTQGKETHFLLRGKEVNMRDVHVHLRRKKIHIGNAIAAYTAGRSKECRDLRALTPEHVDAGSWETPDLSYENALRAFSALFYGLVDTSYYWVESSEIVMPPSALRGEMSDVCCSIAAFTSQNSVDMMTIRKLALLLELVVGSQDAWIHCRLIYTLWIISTAGHPTIVTSLLNHLKGLVATHLRLGNPHYRFVQLYSDLHTSHSTRLAADMISLKADMVRGLKIEDNPVAFKLRSLDYDVFWRRREQGAVISAESTIDLFERCHATLGPLAVETLTVVRAVLQDGLVKSNEFQSFAWLLDYLRERDELDYHESPPRFSFNGLKLGMEAASELAYVYCLLDYHDTEAWIFDRLLVHQKQTASGLRREYSLLLHISRCEVLSREVRGQDWLKRRQEIEGIWKAEVEAAASRSELLASVTSAAPPIAVK